MNTDLITRAEQFAREAHAHIILETRAGVKWPHINHLEDVSTLVRDSGGSEEEIAAAWLHDSVEDTSTTLDQLEALFNTNIRHLVDGLTDTAEFTKLSLEERKRAQAHRVKNENISVRRIKLADQTANVRRMAVEGTATMTHEEHIIYLKGAKLIADQCKGISTYLEETFEDAYKRAAEAYDVDIKL